MQFIYFCLKSCQGMPSRELEGTKADTGIELGFQTVFKIKPVQTPHCLSIMKMSKQDLCQYVVFQLCMKHKIDLEKNQEK